MAGPTLSFLEDGPMLRCAYLGEVLRAVLPATSNCNFLSAVPDVHHSELSKVACWTITSQPQS